jgi:hypothetical protein
MNIKISRPIKITIVIVVAISLIISFSCVYFITSKNEIKKDKYISAFNAKLIADTVILEHGISMPLTQINAVSVSFFIDDMECERIDENSGNATGWIFQYYHGDNITKASIRLQVYVYADGHHTWFWSNTTNIELYIEPVPLQDLNLDSFQAYSVIMNNVFMHSYKVRYPDANTIQFYVFWWKYHGGPTWWLSFRNGPTGEESKVGIVDANTGQWVIQPLQGPPK